MRSNLTILPAGHARGVLLAAIFAAPLALSPVAGPAFAQDGEAGERHGLFTRFHHGPAAEVEAKADDGATEEAVAQAPAGEAGAAESAPARPAHRKMAARHHGTRHHGARHHGARHHGAHHSANHVVFGYDPSRHGVNRYSRPAYLGGGRVATTIHVAPYEPYIDGGSVVGAPVYSLARAPVPARIAPVFVPVYRHYHLHGGW